MILNFPVLGISQKHSSTQFFCPVSYSSSAWIESKTILQALNYLVYIYILSFLTSPYFLFSCHHSLLSWVFAAAVPVPARSQTETMAFATSTKIMCSQMMSVVTAKKRYQLCLQSLFLLFFPRGFWKIENHNINLVDV